MKCMNCGAELNGSSVYCPACGCDISVQKQAVVLSGLYYNQGLEKAQVRDLSGSIDQLKRSLKFNKLNIPARNLLGLVYFETGEVVSALSEWVISKNIQPEHNIASEYIDDLRKDANRLDTINQTIKKYNLALENCGNGNEDMAEIQLKKILAQNPKLIKGYHLLALLYMRKEQYEKARKLLKKAARIDRTNTTTLRFLHEVDEQTGMITSLEPRFSFWSNREKKQLAEKINEVDDISSEEPVISRPISYTEKRNGRGLLSMIIGIAVGIAFVWFLVMPARLSAVNKDANEKVLEYATDLADKEAELESLQSKVSAAETSTEDANAETSNINTKLESYAKLLTAYNALSSGKQSEAAEAIAEVDDTLLDSDAKTIYDSLLAQVGSLLLSQFKESGIEAFNNKDYTTAITKLEKAKTIDDSDYDVLNYLGHAYRLNNDTEKADENFLLIVEKYPNTTRAENAKLYLSEDAQSKAESVESSAGSTQPSSESSSEEGDEESQEEVLNRTETASESESSSSEQSKTEGAR